MAYGRKTMEFNVPETNFKRQYEVRKTRVVEQNNLYLRLGLAEFAIHALLLFVLV